MFGHEGLREMETFRFGRGRVDDAGATRRREKVQLLEPCGPASRHPIFRRV